MSSEKARRETVAEMSDYERSKAAPLNARAGYVFAGAELRGDEDFDSEPNQLVLSFEGAPDVVVSVWHGMGASGFDIEASE